MQRDQVDALQDRGQGKEAIHQCQIQGTGEGRRS